MVAAVVGLKGRRFAKLSLAGVDVLLGTVEPVGAPACGFEEVCKAGVDLPEMGGVGRRAG